MKCNKKDIIIISHFVDFPWEKGNDRFLYIADMLVSQGAEVEVVTSDFIHIQKEHRKLERVLAEKVNFKITLLHETGYRKNVCLKRIKSHRELGARLREYLKKRRKPDVIYCAVPSLDLAWEASEYAKKNKVEFIIDIQDLWPEAFELVLPYRPLGSILFSSLKRKAEKIYSRADRIVAVSETYLIRGKRVNTKEKNGLSVYLGTDLKKFEQFKEIHKVLKNKDEIWLVYVGTLGHSYDLTGVLDALEQLNNPCIRFMILGDGPLKNKLEEYAKVKNLYCTFTGRLPYPQMVSLLCQCDIAINPIMSGAAQSIINKVGDYAAAGLPVISTQECEEYKNLLIEYQCGFTCENGNVGELATRIKLLSENSELRSRMGKNSRKLGLERFDRAKTYLQICHLMTDKI